MGKIEHGLAGHYRGKIGNLVFYLLKGKQVVRTIGKMTKPPTPAQLKCRQEMSVAIVFLKSFIEFINVGFKLMAKGTNKLPVNVALSFNKKFALQGIYPNIEMNYEKVLVTQGNLREALNPEVKLVQEGLRFTWISTDNLFWPMETDQVMMLAYFPVLQKAIYVLYGERRSKCADVLKIPDHLLNEYMEVYISFIAEDRQSIANSTYLKSFNK